MNENGSLCKENEKGRHRCRPLHLSLTLKVKAPIMFLPDLSQSVIVPDFPVILSPLRESLPTPFRQ